MLNKLKKQFLKGKNLNFLDISKCDYNDCDSKKFEISDKIICFVACEHYFHKNCFQNLKEDEGVDYINIDECCLCAKTE